MTNRKTRRAATKVTAKKTEVKNDEIKQDSAKLPAQGTETPAKGHGAAAGNSDASTGEKILASAGANSDAAGGASGVAGVQSGMDGSNSTGDSGSVPAARGVVGADDWKDPHEGVMPLDAAVQVAQSVACRVTDHISETTDYFHQGDEDSEEKSRRFDALLVMKTANALASLQRQIGKDRATTAVCAQQLIILKLFHDPDFTPEEELLVSTFLSVLAGIDAFDRGRAERLAAEQRKVDEPKPLPIEDTTLEPVDGPMDTI